MQPACNVFLTYQQQNPFLKLRILESLINELPLSLIREGHFLVSISDTSRKIIVRIAEWLESQWILML